MPHNNTNAPDPAPRGADPPKLEGGRRFVLHTPFQPAGDQPTAIAELTGRRLAGERNQVLLGATGTGKTFTMAKVIEETQRPAIILAPNKTLAAQLVRRIQGLLPRQRGGILRHPTTTTTSPRPMSPGPTPISRRNPRSTNRSTGCATRPPGRFWNAMT
jgi:hypothetical protein